MKKMKTIWGARSSLRPVTRAGTTRHQAMGHTAYQHVGLGDTSDSSPYYLFGAQRRYAYAWHGGAGGVPQGYRAAESRGLGGTPTNCMTTDCFGALAGCSCAPKAMSGADIIDSGLDEYSLAHPAFKLTHIHDPTILAMSDWPLVRPQGPEPLDPHGGALGLSDNEKTLGVLLAIGAGAFFIIRSGRRRKRRR